MSDELNPDVARTDMVGSRMAAILRGKSGMERRRLAQEAWELAHDRLTVFLVTQAELLRYVAGVFEDLTVTYGLGTAAGSLRYLGRGAQASTDE